MTKKILLTTISFLTALQATRVFAGPPFLTDDPEPADYKHFEFNPFATIDSATHDKNILGPGIEVDYGLVPNLEVNITFSQAAHISHQEDEDTGHGFSDTELGMTWRFLEETDFIPQISFSPAYFVPTGDINRGIGNGRGYYTLPFWAQKSWNTWIIDAGGGYTRNTAPDQFNNFYGGFLIQKKIGKKWILGGEIFEQGAISDTEAATTLINVGGTYNITDNLALLFSVGHSVAGESHLISYLGLDWTV